MANREWRVIAEGDDLVRLALKDRTPNQPHYPDRSREHEDAERGHPSGGDAPRVAPDRQEGEETNHRGANDSSPDDTPEQRQEANK